MKKKLRNSLAIALALVMVLALAACGGGNAPAPAPAPAPSPAPSTSGTTTPGTPDSTPAGGLTQTRTSVLTIDFAHANAATHNMHIDAVMPFAEAFMEATEGMINVIVHPGATVVSPGNMWDDVTFGAVDIAYGTVSYSPGRFPLTEVLELPMTFASGRQATQVVWDLLENNEAFLKQFDDFKIFAMWSTPGAQLWAKNTPIRLPSDIQGLIIRVPSAIAERSIQAAGGSTINIPMQEAYDAIDRGVADGLALDFSGMSSFNMDEVINYGIGNMNQYISFHMMAMSWDCWNSLNEFEQEALMRVGGRNLSTKANESFESDADISEKRIRDGNLIELVELTAEDRAQWQAAFSNVVSEYLDSVNNRGFDATGVYEDALKYRDARS